MRLLAQESFIEMLTNVTVKYLHKLIYLCYLSLKSIPLQTQQYRVLQILFLHSPFSFDRTLWIPKQKVSAVMNLRVPQNMGNFLTSWRPASFSWRTLLHGEFCQNFFCDKKISPLKMSEILNNSTYLHNWRHRTESQMFLSLKNPFLCANIILFDDSNTLFWTEIAKLKYGETKSIFVSLTASQWGKMPLHDHVNSHAAVMN
jgi:hypothetical protein